MTGILEQDHLRGRRVRLLVWGLAATAFLLPLVAMQFTREVDWDGTDFMAWGVMLLVAVAAYEVAARVARSNAYMAAAGLAAGAAFLTVWANLAVGILGNEDNPANGLFFGVVAVAVLGSPLARFRARGMAWVMVATAVAQLGVCLYAWLAGLGHVFVFTAVMCAIWLAAARLFLVAARRRAGA